MTFFARGRQRWGGIGGWVPWGVVWGVLGVVCVLPLLVLVGAVVLHPGVVGDLRPGAFRMALLGRTLLYNSLAAGVAVLMGVPVGVVLGRSRGWLARGLWVVVPLALLMPSMAFAYGWSQALRLAAPVLRLLGVTFEPGSVMDVGRCIWTLSAYLWAIPACAVGLMLRRADVNVELAAVVDGGLGRVTMRQIGGVVLASFAAALLLASQEFAVYEPTGISVVATEVRMVFDSGAFSSLSNPGTGSVAGGGLGAPDQAGRSAAAIATAVPMLVITGGLAVWIAWLARRQAEASGGLEVVGMGERPRVLEPGWGMKVGAMLLVGLNVVVPVVALWVSLKSTAGVGEVWTTFSPAIEGTLMLGAVTVGVAVLVGVAAVGARPSVWGHVLSLATFLVGGQLLAIAFIRVMNRPGLSGVYDSAAMPVLADVARFVFLPLAAGASTHSRGGWRVLREMAAMDGAGAVRTGWSVVMPLAWPVVLAGGLLVGALSMTEVPATVLLSPQRPQLLVPLLVTWVHMLRYDPMIQASLLMMGLVVGPGVVAVGLLGWGRRVREGMGR